ncbi:coiled-coil domain-containing protein 86 [Stigmatopora nigra]
MVNMAKGDKVNNSSKEGHGAQDDQDQPSMITRTRSGRVVRRPFVPESIATPRRNPTRSTRRSVIPEKKQPDEQGKNPELLDEKPVVCVETETVEKCEERVEPVTVEENPEVCVEPELVEEKPEVCAEPEPVEEKPEECVELEPVEEKPEACVEPEPVDEKPEACVQPEPVEENPEVCVEPEPVAEKLAVCVQPEPVEEKPEVCVEPVEENPEVCVEPEPVAEKLAVCVQPEPVEEKPDVVCVEPEPVEEEKLEMCVQPKLVDEPCKPPQISQAAPVKRHPKTKGTKPEPPKKKICLEKKVKDTVFIPLGKPKSGRVWKDRNKQRFSAMVRDAALNTSWEKKMQAKRDKQLVQKFMLDLKAQKDKAKEDKRKRRAENLKRREENERKAEIVQVIRNTAKIKRMKKKQLRKIEKRDTLPMLQKTNNDNNNTQKQNNKAKPAKNKQE